MSSLGARLYPAIVIVCILYIVSFAWVAEDAFITFRVVANAVQGYGLRWNIDERVQVYTHPLWMLLHIPLYALFKNIFLVTIGLSAACMIGAVLLLLKSANASPVHKIILVLLPLTLSPIFRHYSISGLETPLSCLLAAAFFYSAFHRNRMYETLLLASLCILTRFDNILLLVPALLWLAHRRRPALGKVALSLSPLILWCGFCLLYYGFIFPNTKYAKLNTGIATMDYVRQGLEYVRYSFYFDPLALAAIAMAPVAAFFRLRPETILPAAGALLYSAYVISIGGDFMAGRFFAAPFFVALFALHAACREMQTKRLADIALVMAVLFLSAHFVFNHTYGDRTSIDKNRGIVLERNFQRDHTTLLSAHPLRIRSQVQYEQYYPKAPATIYHIVGMYGFYAPANLIIIDPIALTDAFLARLPTIDKQNWRVGHYFRAIPPGYLETRSTGDSRHLPEALRTQYDEMRLITSAPLWQPERLRAILRQNGLLEHQ